MNNLSLLIYFADILPQIAAFVGTFSIAYLLCFSVYVIICLFNKPERNEGTVAMDYFLDRKKKLPSKWVHAVVPLTMLFLTTLVPSTEIIYLIAGSEVSEIVITSEVGQEVLNDIKEVIDHQLEQLKGN